ncbi:amino acid permease [Desulfocurvibacter africanus]|uniref:amino acid permease n=1 Tax=Desulfocurvibacter africanus TaxID=873 RepID=UPI000412287C|nr:amino acid permease [Desulfocurvibacter africanus]
MPKLDPASKAQPRKFGTFAGVFTPTILTIFGVVLFLRIGWVVGHVGLAHALLIIVVANAISLVTALSLSAVATTMHVGAGGAYYMISRTLGLQIGGAIGVPLYLSQALGTAFYTIGFAESLASLFPGLDARLVASATVLLFGLLAWMGAGVAIKALYVIMAVLAAGLLSFFLGAATSEWIRPELAASEGVRVSLWQAFAIFFPAVTGMIAGPSMSGDLRNPGRSLPRGILTAIAVSAAVYLAVAVCLSLLADPAILRADSLVMVNLAAVPWLVVAGIWTATLSSGLGSMLTAPRTLMALAQDNIVPVWLANRLGSAGEPRAAVLMTTAFAASVAWLGGVNVVAPIITMFFLNTFGMLNLTAGLERLVSSPGFRPRIAVHWSVSLAGALACYAAMFLINPPATVLAILVSFGIYFLLKRRSLAQDFGDIRGGIWLSLARAALLRLRAYAPQPRTWRPFIAVFTKLSSGNAGDPAREGCALSGPSGVCRDDLLDLGSWLCGKSGLATFVHVLADSLGNKAGRGLRAASRRHLAGFLGERDAVAFTESIIAPDFDQGVLSVMQAYGLPGLEPNAALMGWSHHPEKRPGQLRLAHTLLAFRKSVLFLHVPLQVGFGQRRRIDILWTGGLHNGQLKLMTSHLLRRTPEWAQAETRLIRPVGGQAGIPGARRHMSRLLRAAHLQAEPLVFVLEEGRPFLEQIRQATAGASLLLVGLRLPEEDDFERAAHSIDEFLAEMRCAVLLVSSAEAGDLLKLDESSS